MHSLFGTKHLILIGISIILIVLVSILCRKLSLNTWFKTMLYVGIISETIKVFYYIIQNEAVYGGYLPKTDLPFHLCSIQILFIIFLNISHNEKLKRILLSFMLPSCLIGGIAAILIATDSSRNGMWILSLQYFGYHVMLVSFAIHLLTNKEMKWQLKDYLSALKFLAIMGFIAIYINSMFYDVVEYTNENGEKIVEMINRVNFMYVVDPPQSGLPYLNKDQGWFVYIIRYAILAVGAISLIYIKPIVSSIKNLFKNKKVTE